MRTNLSVVMVAIGLTGAAVALAAPLGGGGGSSSSSGSGGSSSGGGGGSSHGGGGGGGGFAGSAGHAGGGSAEHGGAGAAAGNGGFAAARPAFGVSGQRLPELRSLTHGAVVAVRSEERARPPHPIHPTHPIHPKPAPIVRAEYNNTCDGAFGCASPYPNLFLCDQYEPRGPHTFNCQPIRKSKIDEISHDGR
jgi:hypothetical protein